MPVNRIGLDGITREMNVETLTGKKVECHCRIICMVRSPINEEMDLNYLTESSVFDDLSERGVQVGSMFETLRTIGDHYNSDDSYLKVSCWYPYKGSSFPAAIETTITGSKLKSYLSTSVTVGGGYVMRLTIDFSTETEIHIEELLSIAEETKYYKAATPGIAYNVVTDVAQRIEGFERVHDYLVLCNSLEDGTVIQKWKGIPGGMRPMPGLERSIPDI